MSPLPSDAEIAERLVPVRAAVLEATEHTRSPKRSTRFRVTRNVLIAAVAVGALTAGAIAIATREQGYIDATAICFQHASLDSQQQPIQGAGNGPRGSIDPIEACSFIWSEGYFEPGGYDENSSHDFAVPDDLTACTLADGSAGVFPREGRPAHDFCLALGLADWDSD